VLAITSGRQVVALSRMQARRPPLTRRILRIFAALAKTYLAQALAELAIEEHFGLKSAATVYREHLYELEGFHELFHEPRVARIKTLSKIGPGDWPVLPRLSIRLAFHDPYAPRSTTREAHEWSRGISLKSNCSASFGWVYDGRGRVEISRPGPVALTPSSASPGSARELKHTCFGASDGFFKRVGIGTLTASCLDRRPCLGRWWWNCACVMRR